MFSIDELMDARYYAPATESLGIDVETAKREIVDLWNAVNCGVEATSA